MKNASSLSVMSDTICLVKFSICEIQVSRWLVAVLVEVFCCSKFRMNKSSVSDVFLKMASSLALNLDSIVAKTVRVMSLIGCLAVLMEVISSCNLV